MSISKKLVVNGEVAIPQKFAPSPSSSWDFSLISHSLRDFLSERSSATRRLSENSRLPLI